MEIKTMKEYLEMVSEWRKKMAAGNFPYSCIEEFVLVNGREFSNHAVQSNFRGKKIKIGKMKECFKNAFHFAETHGLYYVEGYATTESLGFPFLHAWCVDRLGNIYDPTWKDGKDYFGVIFNQDFVRKTIFGRKAYGVLDNMEQGYPLLTGSLTGFEIGKEVNQNGI